MKYSLSLLAVAGSAIADLAPITQTGSKFFYENGTQFFMKGVAYQQDTAAAGATDTVKSTFKDPLADAASCRRDIPLLAQLGTNTIRTYAIDPTADHSECMSLLQQHGIYVVSDLSQPSLSINRDDPQWTTDLFTRYQKVVDELSQYSNVIGFFAGNEVSNNNTNTAASAYVKAAVRDTKKYIKDTKHRWMGVGYAANDDKDIRRNIADYFNCGDQDDAIDFWGYNIYSWCGDSNFADSGYNDQIEFFTNYSVPVFFAEYGCANPGGAANRMFDETTALYDKNMTEVFSGGIVYMYFEEANDYGLVQVQGNSVTKLKDFSALQSKVNAAHPVGVEKADYHPSNKPATCPKLQSEWQASSDLPPTPDAQLCSCMQKSRTCVRSHGLETDDYGDIFNFICSADKEACSGINGNATTGIYGAYSMCDDGAKLDYVLDAYYKSQQSASTACDFKGKATTQNAADDSSCSKALASASDVNNQAATATAPVGGGSTATGSSSNDDGEGAGMHSATITRVFSTGNTAIGLYMVVSVLVGAGMVML